MAESVVSSVGQTIGRLLVDEAKFLGSVEGKVKDLQKELKLILGLLRDADARQEHDQDVSEWVAQLQDIAYDAEDVIEQYTLRVVLKKKGQNIIKAYARFVVKCTCWHVHVVGTEIEGLKSRISKLTTHMKEYGIQPLNEGQGKQARALMPERTHAYYEEDLVGREDSIEELVKALKDEKQHRVVSIWGMGGLGKTSLAKKVFAHDELKSHFDSFAWACVSKNVNVREILVGIFIKLIPDQKNEANDMSVESLSETLYKIQQDKRCIVFLDDIWAIEDWKNIRFAFPIKNTRSKLLITTRNKEVVEYIDPYGFFHKPLCLSDDESWKLLMKWVFPKTEGSDPGLSSVGIGIGQATPVGPVVEGIARRSETEGQRQEITDDMEKLGIELLKKCGGLPLAVNVLGGLMVHKKWENIYRNINSYLGGDDDVSKVLALSYDDLAWYLKPCFLYLASFPEDEEIHVKKVLHMWIAEGLVSPTAYGEEKEITVEDVAERHLMELANRGMVQLQFTMSGKLKTCYLHDVMRELCIPKVKQGKFLSILNIQRDHEVEECSFSMGIEGESTCKTRRLSLNVHASASAERNITPRIEQIGRTMLHLRTLMFFRPREFKDWMWDQFQPIFTNCKFLRVLKLENLCVSGNLSESVGDLVHLRFLSLAGSKLQGLPQSMGNLLRMEFLDLRVYRSSGSAIRLWDITMPNVLWKMTRLRHLHLPFDFVVGESKKLRLNTLKNLQTLKNFNTKSCDVRDLGKLTDLKKLTVVPCDELEILPQLAKFSFRHIRSSYFMFVRRSFTEEGKIKKLPEHKNLPQQLRKLSLYGSELEEDPMPILEKLQHLIVLMLGFEAFVGKEMVCSPRGFPQLKHLLLHAMPNLEEWRVAEGAMPHLSRLGFCNCPKLKALPQLKGVSTHDSGEDIEAALGKMSTM